MGERNQPEANLRGQLVRTSVAALRRALDLIGDHEDVGDEPSTDLRTLDGQLAIAGGVIRERLRDTATWIARMDVVALSEAISDVHAARFALHDYLRQERYRGLDALHTALAVLRSAADQDELLDVVCESVAEHCGFDRVLLSRVEDSLWRPWRSFSRVAGEAERTFREWMRELPEIRLAHMLLESELVRRREPAMVLNAATDPRVLPVLVTASGLTSYVAAPILSGDRVIGLLHADHRTRDVVPEDRDILWGFAVGFAHVFERAVLLARLREQRVEVMRLMRTIDASLSDLASAEIDLATRGGVAVLAAARPVRTVAGQHPQALESLLTSRELEVLTLMATGATNDRIAQRLVIATGTVKSHVKRILRKLSVDNRAEAISYYLRLTIGARELAPSGALGR